MAQELGRIVEHDHVQVRRRHSSSEATRQAAHGLPAVSAGGCLIEQDGNVDVAVRTAPARGAAAKQPRHPDVGDPVKGGAQTIREDGRRR